jgi:nucleotide-binding universal stress UspA family protein
MGLTETHGSDHRDARPPTTYRDVLVPLDGTPFAEAALEPAARVAARAGGTLHLATAYGGHTADGVTMEPIPTGGLEPKLARDMEAYLTAAGERIAREHGVGTSVRVLTESPPALALGRYASTLDVDLIAVATHGRGVVARAILGSVATDLVRNATCPVLVVPASEGGSSEAPLRGPVRSVLVGIDPEDDPPREVLSHAVAFARFDGATLHVARVVLKQPLPSLGLEGAGPVEVGPGLDLDPKARAEVGERLAELVEQLRSQGVEGRVALLDGARPADALVTFAEANAIDLIVVGRREKSVFARLWSGSESDRVARRAESSGILICPTGNPN